MVGFLILMGIIVFIVVVFHLLIPEEIFRAQDKLHRKSSNTPPKKPNDDMDFVLDENGNIIWLHEKK